MTGKAAALILFGVILGVSAGLMLTPLADGAEEARVALWLEVVHRVCTSIGGLGTFAALIFVALQFTMLRRQTDLLQKNVAASIDSALYTRLDSFNRFIVEHHKIYDLLNLPFDQQQDPEQQAKLHHLCDQGFTFYEEIFKYHTRYQLLRAEDWNEWIANMQHFFGKPYVRGYWRLVAARYAKSFQSFVDDMYQGSPPRAEDAALN